MPDKDPAVANAGLLLVQVPPDGVLFSVTVELTHTVEGPVIAAGNGLTETVMVPVLLQPIEVVPVSV
jgi:hypothetical protein